MKLKKECNHMNQSQFFNKYLILFFITSTLFGKALKPQSDDRHVEFLTKNNKHKEYHKLTKSGLEYNIKGPAEIKIFSKAAFPKKTINKDKQFSFSIFVNELTTSSNNLKKIDRKTFSETHPMHVYTYSAKDVVVVPSGNYKIKIYKESFLDPPILVRVIRSGRKSKKIVKEEFNTFNNFAKYTLNNINSTFSPSYYILDNTNPFFLNQLSGSFEFNLRGLHEHLNKSTKIIQATLLKNGKKDALYHVLSIPHPSTTINESQKIPSKLNKIYLTSSEDNYLFHIQDYQSDLLVRINKVIE